MFKLQQKSSKNTWLRRLVFFVLSVGHLWMLSTEVLLVNAAYAKTRGVHARASNESQYWGASSCCSGIVQPLKNLCESKFAWDFNNYVKFCLLKRTYLVHFDGFAFVYFYAVTVIFCIKDFLARVLHCTTLFFKSCQNFSWLNPRSIENFDKFIMWT